MNTMPYKTFYISHLDDPQKVSDREEITNDDGSISIIVDRVKVTLVPLDEENNGL